MQWAKDKWFSEDKFNHLTGCFFSTWVIYMFSVHILKFTSLTAAWVFAAIFTFYIGIIIELWQTIKNIDDPSWRDLVADIIGIALGVLNIL